MTYTELCISCGTVALLLIGWLMQYLEGEFHEMWLNTCSNEEHLAYMREQERKERFLVYQEYLEMDDGYSQPKRRKHRDNPQRGK